MKQFMFIIVAILALVHSSRVRIIDGSVADLHEFSYQVSLQWNYNNGSRPSHFCSGSILDSKWILTAAHCMQKLSPSGWFEIVAGANDIIQPESGSQQRNMTRFIRHPRYNPSNFKNDIALILLSKPLKLTRNIRTIDLAKKDAVIQQTEANFAGWGSLSKTLVDIFPDKLRKVNLVLRSLEYCKAVWPVDGSQLCAGGYQNASGCTADSGGPLTVEIGTRRVQIGVLSFGEKPCLAMVPVVFSNVLFFYEWIQTTIENK